MLLMQIGSFQQIIEEHLTKQRAYVMKNKVNVLLRKLIPELK